MVYLELATHRTTQNIKLTSKVHYSTLEELEATIIAGEAWTIATCYAIKTFIDLQSNLCQHYMTN